MKFILIPYEDTKSTRRIVNLLHKTLDKCPDHAKPKSLDVTGAHEIDLLHFGLSEKAWINRLNDAIKNGLRKKDFTESPCRHCDCFNPTRIFRAGKIGRIPDGVRLCWKEDGKQHHDFSCFKKAEPEVEGGEKA
jgi:hypothetical protein